MCLSNSIIKNPTLYQLPAYVFPNVLQIRSDISEVNHIGANQMWRNPFPLVFTDSNPKTFRVVHSLTYK